MASFTARYTRIPSGYMGQLIEWPEVVTEGQTLEECRAMLRDALREMIGAYGEIGRAIPSETDLLEPLAVEGRDVHPTA
ncbi:MAG: type II toxin-antitoxin system HicB family antitoxin [Proteobacteria bacterium]|nr:type II toxin-antitoxin system HicB family antitoxin [Pseudomonadota bacterium]